MGARGGGPPASQAATLPGEQEADEVERGGGPASQSSRQRSWDSGVSPGLFKGRGSRQAGLIHQSSLRRPLQGTEDRDQGKGCEPAWVLPGLGLLPCKVGITLGVVTGERKEVSRECSAPR